MNHSPIPKERRKQIEFIFLNHHNNTVPEISRMTGVSQSRVNKVINDLLKKKSA